MKTWILFLVITAATGCTDNKRAGSAIIPEQKMTKVLWDIIQVDEFANVYLISDSLRDVKKERMKLYKQVFRLHQVSEKDFFSSYKYYADHPDIMKELFDTLGNRADREKKAIYMPRDSQP
jgi:hypothetical protein